MALETLKDAGVIDSFAVRHLHGGLHDHPDSAGYVWVDHAKNEITFKIQNGPIKESGVNGCQVDTLISVAAEMIRGLNRQFPCRENSIAITKLEEALHWLKHRKQDRVDRGVEGLNEE